MLGKADVIYYTAYGLMLITAGIFAFLWSIKTLEPIEAVTYWFLSMGVILLALGFLRTQQAPRGSMLVSGFGLFLIVASTGTAAAIFKIINYISALAIIIIFIGLGVLIFTMLGRR